MKAQQQEGRRDFVSDGSTGTVGAAEGKADYSKAVDYLRTSSVMKGVVDKFENGSTKVVFISDGNDRYDPVTNTLYWDPHSARSGQYGYLNGEIVSFDTGFLDSNVAKRLHKIIGNLR